MKQSNIILGIGILVAVILIVGSFFLNVSQIAQQNPDKPVPALSAVSHTVKAIALTPIRAFSNYIIKIN